MPAFYTPQLARSPIFYKSAAALAEKFTYSIYIYTGHYTTNKPSTATYTITKDKIADVVEVGTTTSTTTNKLVDSVKLFTETVEAGDLVYNTTDNTIAIVSSVDSDTTLTLDTDIIVSGEGYKIFSKTSASIEVAELIRDYFKTEYYNLAVDGIWVDIDVTAQITSGTTTATTANKLVDTDNNFIRKLLPSSFTLTVNNITDDTSATVSAVDDDNTLSVSSDIFESGEEYTITMSSTASNGTAWITLDGYGFFKDGLNPGNSVVAQKQALMTNSKIYFIKGKDIIIPVYSPLQSTLDFGITGSSTVAWNAVDNFWNTYAQGWGTIVDDIKIKDGDVQDSGTADGTTTNKLVDSSQDFLTTVKVGMTVYNTTDSTFTNVTAVDSDTQLTLADDIMASGENYEIQNGRSLDKIQYVVISETDNFTGGTVTITDGVGLSLSETITLEELDCSKYTAYRVIFYNRYGALQDIIFDRKSVKNLETSSDEFKRSTVNFNLASFSYDTYKAQKQRIDIQGTESLVLNTSFLDEGISDPIQELLMSQQIWVDEGIENTQSSIHPVIIRSSSVEKKTSVNNKLVSYTIEFEYANDKIQNIR
jgi:hypothetical protein